MLLGALVSSAVVICPNGNSHGETQNADKMKKAVEYPIRLLRRDSFFGLHFDLHPNKHDTSLGADITEEMLDRLLDRIRPDFVQYDCKGHAGYTGYPTKVGYPSPGIIKDSLAIWRNVTRKHGVGLFIHYSGVWDGAALDHHPEWASVGADNIPDSITTSTFGPYVDNLMIPQLNEVTSAYALDGVWVDGDCWGVRLDYSPAAMAAWKARTGYNEAPRKRDDPHWHEWKMFHRERFEEYLCHWVDAMHAFNPELQVTSNWAYTTFMPKPIVANLDFLSGDFLPSKSVDSARVEARYMASNGVTWDLMAWGFTIGSDTGPSLKTSVQLQQEASVVLMLGGGIQVYYQPTRSGYICDTIIETAGEISDFCRARQEACHKSKPVPQVALLYSSETYYDRSDNVLSSQGGPLDDISGALHALLELHYSVDILAEHQLQPRLNEYPVVVLPEAYTLTDDFRQALVDYAEGGGSVVLMGPKCVRLFEAELGVELVGEPQNTPAVVAASIGVVSESGIWQSIRPTTADVIGYRYSNNDTRKEGEPAATVAGCGRGKITAVYGPVALNFFKSHHPYTRQFIGEIMEKAFPDPAVRVDGPPCVDVSLRETTDGRLSVHLLNTANAPRCNEAGVVDFIPAVGPVSVEMKLPSKPKSVSLVPDCEQLDWNWSQGVLHVNVPCLSIYCILIVD